MIPRWRRERRRRSRHAGDSSMWKAPRENSRGRGGPTMWNPWDSRMETLKGRRAWRVSFWGGGQRGNALPEAAASVIERLDLRVWLPAKAESPADAIGRKELDIMMSACEHQDVRTTLTLDDDVAKSLKKEMRRSGTTSLKAVVNHFLRLGLMVSGREERKPFVVQPRSLGLPDGL